MGKAENAGNQNFLFFLQCSFPSTENSVILSSMFRSTYQSFYNCFLFGRDYIFVYWLTQNDKFWTLPNQKSLQTTILQNFKRKKIPWEKKKLLTRRNFSFSQSVFKRLPLQTHKNHHFLLFPQCFFIITLYQKTKFYPCLN